MKVLLEIRPGEGGTDAKLLVGEQSAMYVKYAEVNKLRCEVVSEEKSALG